ncbi:hypothetical protein CPLU01_08714 [Colletotrichum plurivorum]|uniref:Uncharacterized protein n=1 Tax=Colletotrichum plurivorum TaxID=2175906 RepID=A0A8H6KAJ0_9PEZI|nr:hypothetical protein CPLU01_08714 [Colletotrichum plurivorum]
MPLDTESRLAGVITIESRNVSHIEPFNPARHSNTTAGMRNAKTDLQFEVSSGSSVPLVNDFGPPNACLTLECRVVARHTSKRWGASGASRYVQPSAIERYKDVPQEQ